MDETQAEGRRRTSGAEAQPRLADLIEARDWSATAIGPVETWPQSLRTALSICLESRFPILIWWGPELVMLYNDAYAPLIGAKHPRALGQRGQDCFPEIWEIIGPMLAGVRERGEATWSDDQLLVLERSGFPEECYFTFSYSPIRDEAGAVGGVFTAVSETTNRVIGERRLRLLRELASTTAEAESPEDVCTRAARVLRGSVSIPFSLVYLFDESRPVARLVASSGLKGRGGAAAPRLVPLTGETAAPWPLADVAAGGSVFVDDLADRLGADVAAELGARAMLLPIVYAGRDAPSGVLVAGLNDRRPLDDDYVAFLRLVARQLGAASSAAQAFQEERRRADALDELDRAKTLFFTNVSHELRTPLTLILSPLEDLLSGADGLPPDELRRQLDVIRRNAQRLLRLVNTLLDFSRAESGRIDALFQPTDLAAVTTDLASAFHSAVETAGLRLVLDCPPLPEPVWVDREAWEKVVLNLLSNALKFTFAGEIEIRLRSLGDHVELTVRDTGTGIPEDELPRLFERFHRVRDARARTHEGSGIGLALVRELAELHGGSVTVESAVGAGTTFTVRVPTGAAHLPPDRIGGPEGTATRSLGAGAYVEEALRWLPERDGEPTPGREPVGLRDDLPREPGAGRLPDARILIADDNADMRGYLARLLRRHWRVETVADGAEALAAARRDRPDLVLSDVMMPALDGFGLLRELRADPATSSVPVVLVSARAGPESAVEGLEAGADDYLVKPFSARELVARVRANLELARVRVELARLEAAAAERARAERALATLPDGVATVTADGVVELWNAGAARITGVEPGEIVGRRIDDALPGWGALAAALERQPQRDLVHPVELPRGELWLSVVSTPYADGTLYAFRDATESRALEQLRHDLVTTVSHELRTPVSSIYGAAATLARRDIAFDGETRERLTEILRAETERLTRIVDELVTVSTLETGTAAASRRECDVLAVARRALERARERAPDGIALRATLPESCAPLAVDEGRLEQILDTLLDNAVRYSPGGGEVEVAVAEREHEVVLSVRDSGIGIPERHHDRIGEKFFRVDPELHGGVAGLGLGLYICSGLLALMDGRLRFESAEGRGSTFFVELRR